MNNKRKWIYVIYTFILVLLASLCIVVIAQNNKLKHRINDKKESVCHTKKCSNKKDNLTKNENVIFLGDSITEFYKIDEIYDNYQIIGSGKSGYTTEDILDRMTEMLYQYNPTKVFLLIGTNDIMTDTSDEKLEETVDNIEKISEDIKKNRPNAKIYIESIYPVNKSLNSGMVNKRTNDAIKSMNKEIEDYCKKEKISYINMYDELTNDDGDFDEKYSDDGLHPSDVGYAKITRILLPYIYE